MSAALLWGLLVLLSPWLTAVVQARDRRVPTVRILLPTSALTYQTTDPAVSFSGTAKDNIRVVRVTCRTDHGFSITAQGTSAWSCLLTLPLGVTQVTVIAADAAGNQGTDTLTVTVTAPPPPPGPVTVEWSYTSMAGEAFQMERCTVPCGPMAAVAAISLTDRSWVDTAVVPEFDYCYRMAVVTGGTVGPYSNTLCSP